VVAQTLKDRGVEVAVMPTESYFLKPLTSTLEQALGR
jgi:hypothetical protein